MDYKNIIQFWFEEIDPALRWKKDQDFDLLIKSRFEEVHKAAAQCELFEWRDTAEGQLAEIIVLDQFSRNMYRDTSQAFAFDSLALDLAQNAVLNRTDSFLPTDWKAFLFMPYMHSESKIVHETAVELFSKPGLERNLDFELRHKEIIDRFGRYPHRNSILGRKSTEEELEFLKQPGSSF